MMSKKLRHSTILGVTLVVLLVITVPIISSYSSPNETQKVNQVTDSSSLKKHQKGVLNSKSLQNGIVDESPIVFISRMNTLATPTDSHTKLAKELFSKLQNNQYLDIEKYFDELIKTKEKGKDGIHLIYHIYNELSSNYMDSGFDVFNSWCEKSSHHSAFMTRAGYYIKTGWQARGQGYATKVSSEQFEAFRENLSLAYNDLIQAYNLCQTNPIIPMAMLQIARGNRIARQQLNKWYQIGVNIDPSFYWIYKQYFNAILPKWGGTLRESEDFVLKININPPPGSLVYTLKFSQIKDQISRKKYRLNKSEFDIFFLSWRKLKNNIVMMFQTLINIRYNF